MTTSLRPQRGQDAAEFALIFPILFLILMAIFDMGRAIYYTSTLYSAAREGARYGSVAPDDADGIRGAVQYLAVGIPQASLIITPTVTGTYPNRTVQVAVQYDMPIVTPLIGQFFGGSNSVSLHSEATMYTER